MQANTHPLRANISPRTVKRKIVLNFSERTIIPIAISNGSKVCSKKYKSVQVNLG